MCLIQTQLLEQDPIGTGARLESKLAQGYRGADSVIMSGEEKPEKAASEAKDEEVVVYAVCYGIQLTQGWGYELSFMFCFCALSTLAPIIYDYICKGAS